MELLLKRVCAFVFRLDLVWLKDRDGEVNLRFARNTPFGVTCVRFRKNICRLQPDGTVTGVPYVTEWKYDSDFKREQKQKKIDNQ
jgi:hypothetical protein